MSSTTGKEIPKTQKRPNMRYVVRAPHLFWLRGLWMAKIRADVTAADFCKLIGISVRLYNSILVGDRTGGFKTLKGIMALRERGLVVHLSDFAEPRPTPKAPPLPAPPPDHRS